MSAHSATPMRGRVSQPEPENHDGRRPGGLTAVSLFLVLVLFWVVTRIEYVIVLGLFSLLLGTVLEGPVGKLQKRRIPRPAAIAMIYTAIIGTLVLMVVLIAPPIADQVSSFRDDIPGQVRELQLEWEASANPLLSGTGASLLGTINEWFEDTGQPVEVSPDDVQNAIPLISNIAGGLVAVVTTLVVTFYYLMEKAFIRNLVISQLSPSQQPRVSRLWQEVEDKVGAWMRGQLMLCLIIGAIATTSYGILGITFWPLLGLWAGLTEIIPIVGPWIGGIPAVIVALTMGWDKAIAVAIVIICMQTLENWFLVPRVMRGAVGLTPLAVFVAILAGTQFMGVIGAVLAIPIAAAIQVILNDYFTEKRLKRDPGMTSGWRWMLSRAGRELDEFAEDVAPGPDPDETGLTGEWQAESPNVVPQRDPEPEPERRPEPKPDRKPAVERPAPAAKANPERAKSPTRAWDPFRAKATPTDTNDE